MSISSDRLRLLGKQPLSGRRLLRLSSERNGLSRRSLPVFGQAKAEKVTMSNVVTCLGFNNQAEEAVNFYTSIVRNSRILSTSRSGDAGPGAKGMLISASFVLDGQEFLALNGGPSFTFTTGVSVVVKCDTQAEIDALWSKLTAGGQESRCGWLVDRFGLSWQIIPRNLGQLLGHADPAKSSAAVHAMLQMNKLDIAALQRAADDA
jgi:predicted 3-demethylubiquinone-9 3-methyltransferase (glyoxalase superfamily)